METETTTNENRSRACAPAFPCEVDYHRHGTMSGRQTANTAGFEIGLTKREYFAALAMQGLAIDERLSVEKLAEVAVAMADAVLKELAKE